MKPKEGGYFVIKCKRCGNELQEDSVFCSKCGVKINGRTDINILFKIKSINKRHVLFGSISVLCIIVLVMIILFLNNPVQQFKRALDNNNLVKASKIYDEKIKGDMSEETEAISYIKSDIRKIGTDFKGNKIEYDLAISLLESIGKTGLASTEVSYAKTQVNKLNDSRIAYKKGVEFLDNKNYVKGLAELKKVIAEDNNFEKAQKFISNSIKDYRTEAMAEAEMAAENSDYDEAINLLKQVLLIIPNDSDIIAKKFTYEELNDEKKATERQLLIEELKEKQEITVVSTKVFKDWLGWDNVEVIVKNNTEKVVKKYTVGWMCYDKDGFPIKTGSYMKDYLEKGKAEQNIQPGKTFGSGYGWELHKDTGAKTVLACVVEAEYYDGSIWFNPYYDFWVENYKEKPLK